MPSLLEGDMKRFLLSSNAAILGSYVVIVATLSLVARWQLGAG